MDCGVTIVMWHLFDESGLDQAEAASGFTYQAYKENIQADYDSSCHDFPNLTFLV